MREKGSDFVGKKKTVVCEAGHKIEVVKPTLGWWYDVCIPKIKELQLGGGLPAELKKEMVKELSTGELSMQTLNKIPMPVMDILLEIIIYYSGKDAAWCKQNLYLEDMLSVINAFLEVADFKRVMDFFVKIGRQAPPLMAMMMKGVSV